MERAASMLDGGHSMSRLAQFARSLRLSIFGSESWRDVRFQGLWRATADYARARDPAAPEPHLHSLI